MDRIDGFLSRKIQRVYPDALVYCLKEGTEEETWELRRAFPEVSVGLGINFREAKHACDAIFSAMVRRQKGK